jgi:tripeptide aminopeptidase
MRAYERLLKYVKIYTTSDEESGNTPSAQREFDLGNLLAEELKEIGVENVRITEQCYVYGEIPATPGYEQVPALGFIAHMDTAPDFCGEGVKPQIIGDYDGNDIQLGQSGRVLSCKAFPDLRELKGRTLITTDGTTLLGADDKAGLAEIMTMAEQLIREKTPHGKICVAFTPDEEIGEGADHFDVEGFGAKYAYTVDGGAENEIEYENFNAAGAQIEITGLSVHPGDSKDTMINAALVAMEFNQMLPSGETPRGTSGYEGFFHLTDMSGDVSEAKLSYIIRDHSAAHFEVRKEQMQHIADLLNEKYGQGTVKLAIKDQYRNMREKIEDCMFLIDYANIFFL